MSTQILHGARWVDIPPAIENQGSTAKEREAAIRAYLDALEPAPAPPEEHAS